MTTLLVYGALSALFLFLMLMLQNVLHYSALKSGASLLPINALMLLISPRVGRLAERIGARMPMAVGSLVAAAGMALFTRVHAGGSYATTLLPAVCVFGLGLSMLVAPLTAAVLESVPPSQVGLASAVNNAVSRLAGLLATAIIPLVVGMTGASALTTAMVARGFVRGMWVSAALCAVGAVTAWLTISSSDERK